MIRLSDMLGCRVFTESGRKLGRVHEVRVTRRTPGTSDHTQLGWLVDGIVVGNVGLLERLGVRGAQRSEATIGSDVVRWDDVVALEDGRAIVRDRAG
jgi:sporulation protein YlmC with PRC-barrel domain